MLCLLTLMVILNYNLKSIFSTDPTLCRRSFSFGLEKLIVNSVKFVEFRLFEQLLQVPNDLAHDLEIAVQQEDHIASILQGKRFAVLDARLDQALNDWEWVVIFIDLRRPKGFSFQLC